MVRQLLERRLALMYLGRGVSEDTSWPSNQSDQPSDSRHRGHNDAKGRVADFVLAQGQDGMRSSILTTGPYMDMLCGGLFIPKEEEDGTFVWANPGSTLHPSFTTALCVTYLE